MTITGAQAPQSMSTRDAFLSGSPGSTRLQNDHSRGTGTPQPEIRRLLADLISGDDERAEAAVEPLAAGGERALTALLSSLRDPSPDHRWWVTRALANFSHPKAIEHLLLSLEDPELSVRQCAALGLRLHPSLRAIAPLIKALYGKDRLLSRLASDALCAIGNPAIRPLREASQAADPAVRIEAVRALAGMRDPQAIPVLVAALDDHSSIVEYWAGRGLERLGVGMVFFNP